eukprot:scaffold9422_cov31-Tisochrysis_lutea.AAC.2
MAICTTPLESESGPVVMSGIMPVCDPPGAICCGMTCPSAAGDSGLSPKERDHPAIRKKSESASPRPAARRARSCPRGARAQERVRQRGRPSPAARNWARRPSEGRRAAPHHLGRVGPRDHRRLHHDRAWRGAPLAHRLRQRRSSCRMSSWRRSLASRGRRLSGRCRASARYANGPR